jgi:hypothetical protein
MINDEIFSIYRKHCRVLLSDGRIGNYFKVESNMNVADEVHYIDFCDEETGDYEEKINIEKCKLILKSRQDMNEQERIEYISLQRWYIKDSGERVIGGLPIEDVIYYDTFESYLWLIKHGFAIDDKWFEEGITIRESELVGNNGT